MTFLIFAAGLALVTLILATVLGPMLISDRRGQDSDVYRDQLAALDKDRTRGIVTGGEYDALRAEIARRLLSATRAAPMVHAGRHNSVSFAAVGLSVFAGLGLYMALGSPGAPDAPLNLRIAQADTAQARLPDQATLDAARPAFAARGVDDDDRAQLEQLRLALVTRPDDLRGFTLLARGESRLGNFPAAHRAQRRVLELKGDLATTEDWGLYTEFLLLASGEVFSAQARAALLQTLRRNPQAGLARFRLGQLRLQTGRPDIAFSIWADLLTQGPEAAPYVPAIRAQIDELAIMAGITGYQQPRPRGLGLQDIENAEDLSPEDRAAMIETMVAGLADRLANDGGPATEWAQLIRAFGVLGRGDQARAIYQEARITFAGRPADLRLLDAAIDQIGGTE